MKFSSGIIPVKKSETEYKFLLLRCYNYWDFPKGEVEKGEDPLDASLREIYEETGIKAVTFNWGETFKETSPYSQGKIARYYLAEVSDSDIRLSKEHHGYRWLSYEEARLILVPRLQFVLDWAQNLISMKA